MYVIILLYPSLDSCWTTKSNKSCAFARDDTLSFETNIIILTKVS